MKTHLYFLLLPLNKTGTRKPFLLRVALKSRTATDVHTKERKAYGTYTLIIHRLYIEQYYLLDIFFFLKAACRLRSIPNDQGLSVFSSRHSSPAGLPSGK